jgi:hypothetical protein
MAKEHRDETVMDAEMRRRAAAERRLRVRRAVNMTLWAVPTIILMGCIYAYAKEPANGSAVLFIGGSCVWLGINIDRHFKVEEQR